MTSWTSDELNKIGTAEELQIASFRSDGSLRKPVTIWVVRLSADLYVRSVNGRSSAWFRGTLVCHAGHIQAGGMDKDVTYVEETDPEINHQLDAVYRKKYHRYGLSIVNTIVSADARSATIKLVPRAAST
jgi:hypothetical protein